MLKKSIVLSVLFLFLIPFSTQAFSWRSLAFWEKKEIIKENTNVSKLDSTGEKQAQEKLAKWSRAFQQKKWTEVKKDANNFQITEAELNYLLADALKKESDLPAKNVYVKLSENKITLTGQLLKPITGKFETVLLIETTGKSIAPKIEKMRFKGIPMPKSIANKFIGQYFPQASEFLYTYPDYQTLTVEINNGLLKLIYNK